MAKTKFYAVKNGRKTGIFYSWAECEAQVKGYPGAIYKSFLTQEAALDYLDIKQTTSPLINNPKVVTTQTDTQDLAFPYAFVDGSYNINTKEYGYGGFIQIDANTQITLQGKGSDKQKATMRNVAGEIDGALVAVEKAIENHLPQLTIYYDYQGVENWVTGSWQAKNTFTQTYRDQMRILMQQIAIKFVKVKGHSGIYGNELADKLAKQSVGIE